MNSFARFTLLVGLLLSGLTLAARADWCPFCTAIQQTFAEQMGTSDIVILAELVQLPTEHPKDDQLPKAMFRVTEVIKGLPDVIAVGREFKSILVGQPQVGQTFLLMGVDPPEIAWTTPMKLSPASIEYLQALPKLPAKGVERLKFFQNYFEHDESMLAFDAYEEFARASYAEINEMKPFLHREKILKWIQNPDISTNRKRLYFTLLGVCGTAEDLPLLETLLTSEVNETRRGLDAMVACYLTLKGESGLDLIEREFFVNPKSEYVDTFAAISAIRFLASEKNDIPRARILSALHKVLDRPALADLVIPDLARWEDWSVIEKMVALFKNSTEDTKWVRVPVVSYLQVCPKPEAKLAIDELKKIDPESVRRAETLLKWESGEDEFEENADGSDTKTEAPNATQPAPSESKKVDDDGTSEPIEPVSINVPIYEVRRLPTAVSESPPLVTSIDSVANDQFVATTSNLNPGPPSAESIAERAAPSALVARTSNIGSSLAMIFVPLASFVLLFLLVWSVFNGWFERLIF